jgi:hypothetical protein
MQFACTEYFVLLLTCYDGLIAVSVAPLVLFCFFYFALTRCIAFLTPVNGEISYFLYCTHLLLRDSHVSVCLYRKLPYPVSLTFLGKDEVFMWFLV